MEKYYFINTDTDTNTDIEVGLDEAGRGPLIGNVYAGAVIWDPLLVPPEGLIIDSKKLSKKKRKLAFEWIKNNIKHYSVGFATNEEIDRINILEATKLAMDRALINLNIIPTHLIIDGIGWENKFTNYTTKSIIKGDTKYYSIAAASILAKEYHDEHILELCANNSSLIENYSLNTNMGYGSKKHIDGIKLHGYTNLHRKSFKIKSL
jgi:ribonuclease HII